MICLLASTALLPISDYTYKLAVGLGERAPQSPRRLSSLALTAAWSGRMEPGCMWAAAPGSLSPSKFRPQSRSGRAKSRYIPGEQPGSKTEPRCTFELPGQEVRPLDRCAAAQGCAFIAKDVFGSMKILQ